MNLKKIVLITCMATVFTACDGKKEVPDNPFFHQSTLQYGAPDFAKIHDSDFLPAITAGIEQQKSQIDSIVNNSDTPTFENTILPYERSGGILRRTTNVFYALQSADNTDSIQAIDKELVPKVTAWNNEISLNKKLFDRIKYVYDHQLNDLKGEDHKLLEQIYKSFVLQGANLPDDKKEELKKLNTKLAVLSQKFNTKLTEATNAAGVWVDDEKLLDGLSDEMKAQCKADAAAAGGKAPYLIVISNTTQQPILAYLNNRTMRERVYDASIHRADSTSNFNTLPLVTEIANLRAQKAALLGYPNFASYSLVETMAKTPENVYYFLNNIIKQYNSKRQDSKDIQAFARQTESTAFELQPYDYAYYSAKMKQNKFKISDSDLRPYFNLDSVLVNGVFYAANKLYGLTFKRRIDLPVYHADVNVYDVYDKDGKILALFYTDYFRRPTKSGGAWMSAFQKQSYYFNHLPIVYNVCNFAKPADGQPCLLSYDEVTTMFHEFGHALQGMFSQCKYNTLSGTAVSRDFVEMPSQFNENWATVPEIFNHYAKDYRTGEAMPTELKEKMLNSIHFQPSYALGENLAATCLDMAWHMLPDSVKVSAEQAPQFEQEALKKMNIDIPTIPPRYMTSYFRHIWGGGYAAGYYSYLWSDVLAVNCFDIFEQAGGVNTEVAQQFRDKILSKGNTLPLEQIFTDFTGLKQPDTEQLLKAKGL